MYHICRNFINIVGEKLGGAVTYTLKAYNREIEQSDRF